jgi:hypothetical protein
VRTDAVALALIEARLAAAREQQLVAQIRQARREARREARQEQRALGARRWWVVRRRPRTRRVLVITLVEPAPDDVAVTAGPAQLVGVGAAGPVDEHAAKHERVAL